MGIPGLVPMVATNGKDITEIHSTLTIIDIMHFTCITLLNFSVMYSRCSNGLVLSTRMLCPPKPCECDYACVEKCVLVFMHEC